MQVKIIDKRGNIYSRMPLSKAIKFVYRNDKGFKIKVN